MRSTACGRRSRRTTDHRSAWASARHRGDRAMDDDEVSPNIERRLDPWLREESSMPAPNRLLEDVFSRTERSRQIRHPWSGWLTAPLRAGSHGGGRPVAGLALLAV